jgi:hypothetical protein
MIAPEIDRGVLLVERIDSRIGPTGAVPDESAGELVSDLRRLRYCCPSVFQSTPVAGAHGLARSSLPASENLPRLLSIQELPT